jgi:hypothetical protein
MFAPRSESGGFAGKGGKPGFGGAHKSFAKKPFAPRDRSPFDRSGGGFEARAPHAGDAGRGAFDRPSLAGRPEHKPAGAGPRKPGFSKPQRPRPGGFDR